jgi:hypothetical protein
MCRNRRVAVGGKEKISRTEMHWHRQNVGHDRKRVDARIENTHTARLEDPVLTRMPAAHVLFPVDMR